MATVEVGIIGAGIAGAHLAAGCGGARILG
jgi:hypothetical protein